MEFWERELYIGRIVAGQNSCCVGESRYHTIPPTREQRLTAAEIYRDARREARLDGALQENELLHILDRQGIWTTANEEEHQTFTKALDDLKVTLFENSWRSNAKLTIRTAIRKTRDELDRLDTIRHCLDHVTIDWLASMAKYRYMIASCLMRDDGSRYWLGDASMHKPDAVIDKVIEKFSQDRLDETRVRELARTEPWRSIWGIKGNAGRGVFDAAAIDLTDEQRSIALWSTIYDNIREFADCPSDSIIEDDDMLDGWMIIKRREREMAASKMKLDNNATDKIRDADEVFIQADTMEDAREIEKLNDAMAKHQKAQRATYLKKHGEVNEENMPDTAQRIRMEMNKLESMKARGK